MAAAVGVRESRALLDRAARLVDLVGAVDRGRDRLRGDVEKSFVALREPVVHRELGDIPVARLRETSGGRLRIGSLEQAGLRTVLDVYVSSSERLRQLPGVGTTSATQLIAAACQVACAVRDGLRVRVDLDPADTVSTALIVALHKLRGFEGTAETIREPARRLADELDLVLPVAAATGAGCAASSLGADEGPRPGRRWPGSGNSRSSPRRPGCSESWGRPTRRCSALMIPRARGETSSDDPPSSTASSARSSTWAETARPRRGSCRPTSSPTSRPTPSTTVSARCHCAGTRPSAPGSRWHGDA